MQTDIKDWFTRCIKQATGGLLSLLFKYVIQIIRINLKLRSCMPTYYRILVKLTLCLTIKNKGLLSCNDKHFFKQKEMGNLQV